MLFEKFKQNRPRFARHSLDAVEPGEIQISLIKSGRHADTFFKTCDRFIAALRPQIKHAEIVQSLWIFWANLQRSLQIFIGVIAVVHLRKHHSQTIVRLRILRSHSHRPLQNLASIFPLLLLAICIAKIIQCDQVIGIKPQSFLKIRNRLAGATLARCQQSEVVPGIGQGIRITGIKFNRAFKTVSRFYRVPFF